MSKKLQAIFGDPVDLEAVRQIENVLNDERAITGALMADHHVGYSMPIGGVVAYDNAISPSGVGFDIACGNKAVRTEIRADELDIPIAMLAIQSVISFGLGRSNPTPVEHELFDDPVWDELGRPGIELKKKAREQLGTVGSGNHYVDLLKDEDDYVWVANHFGSRGLGHTIATMGLRWGYGLAPDDKRVERDEPAVLDLDTELGKLYLAGMTLAGEYAYAGRDYVIDQVLGILGRPQVTLEVHNHHNFAWLEGGNWVVRKGATPLTRNPAFIGGSMGDISAVVRGRGACVSCGRPVGNEWCPAPCDTDLRDSNNITLETADIGALDSAPHGAGRVMSRTKAAGKWKKINEERTRPDGTTYTFKKRMRDASTAAIDWPAVQKELRERGIVVLGSGADEAPGVYKDLRSVLDQHSNIEIMHTLEPLGVVMAGDDVVDPFKD